MIRIKVKYDGKEYYAPFPNLLDQQEDKCKKSYRHMTVTFSSNATTDEKMESRREWINDEAILSLLIKDYELLLMMVDDNDDL